MRQWVLTLPYRLRYALAYDHPLCRAVLAVFVRAVLPVDPPEPTPARSLDWLPGFAIGTE